MATLPLLTPLVVSPPLRGTTADRGCLWVLAPHDASPFLECGVTHLFIDASSSNSRARSPLKINRSWFLLGSLRILPRRKPGLSYWPGPESLWSSELTLHLCSDRTQNVGRILRVLVSAEKPLRCPQKTMDRGLGNHISICMWFCLGIMYSSRKRGL